MSQFDLQLAFQPSLEDAEDAIVAALQADATIAAYARHVISFAGTWEEARRDALKQLPAILVVYVGGRFEPRGRAGAAHVVEWHVVVAAKNLRNERRGRQGAGGEVGAYQMLRDVVRVLGNADLGVDGMGPLQARESQAVRMKGPGATTPGSGVYRLVFTGTLDLVAAAPPDSLETIQSEYRTANTDETDGSVSWVSVANDTTDLEVS